MAVTLIDDTVNDNDEEFRLLLSNPVEAQLDRASATGTIRDLDRTVSEGSNDLLSTTRTGGIVAVGGSVTGELESTEDVDWFRASLGAGQTYQIDLEGWPTGQEGTLKSGVLRIYDRHGSQVPFYWDSHSGYGNNARLYFQPETGGSYYFAAAPGGAGNTGHVPQSGTYRLSMADVTDTEIPASTATAASVAVGGTATGEIEASGDQDWFRVELEAGKTYLIEQRGIIGFLDDPWLIPDGTSRFKGRDWRGEDLPDHGTLLTPLIRGIRDADGNLIAGTAQTDLLTLWLDHSSGNESKPYYVGRVEFTPEETDTYYIVAGSHTGYTGTYEVSVEEGKPVWKATMTVGSSTVSANLFGWDGDSTLLENDDLTDADLVYANETYELSTIIFNSDIGGLTVTFDATNSGSISDAAVRRLMTLHVEGTAFALGNASYALLSSGRHVLNWQNARLTWAPGDTVQLEMRVSE